jgi:anti-anti-sigma factor
VLDLARVEFLPSLALSLLVKIHKQLAQAECKLVLAGLRPNVLEVVRITALNKYLRVCPTTEEGLKLVGE